MEIFNCEQGSQEWFECRKGVVTASEVHTVMAIGRNGAPSETRKKYLYRLAAEVFTGTPCPGFEGNADTERGQELEPVARELYAEVSGVEVQQVGFIRNERMGCSPDGLVGDAGGCEIKSKRPYNHIEVLVRDEVPAEHLKQIQAALAVTGRAWWDFVAYAPGLPLFIKRVERDEPLIAQINEAVDAFNVELKALVAKIKNMH